MRHRDLRGRGVVNQEPGRGNRSSTECSGRQELAVHGEPRFKSGSTFFSTLRGRSRSRKGPWCLRFSFVEASWQPSLSLAAFPVGSSAVRSSGRWVCNQKCNSPVGIPQARGLFTERLPACGVATGAYQAWQLLRDRSTNLARSVAMIFVILLMCVFSGIVISRPIVRAIGLR